MIEIGPDTPVWQFVVLGLALVLPILPNLWSIWHAYFREFDPPHEKFIWMGLAVFIPVLGGLAYLFYGIRRGRKPSPKPEASSGDAA